MNSSLVTEESRYNLDDVEPFDEWEEFILFASHYFLLLATKTPCNGVSTFQQVLRQQSTQPASFKSSDRIKFVAKMTPIPRADTRKFGALISAHPNHVGHIGGLGQQNRLGTVDVYGPPGSEAPSFQHNLNFEPRMCHTVTHISGGSSLLVGGRLSPSKPLQDCWRWPYNGVWERVHDLPIPLFRHSTASVSLPSGEYNISGVLLYGGKTSGSCISNKWFLWREDVGWAQLQATGDEIRPRFGAAMTSTDLSTGLLIGGMTDDNSVIADPIEWALRSMDENPVVVLQKVQIRGQEPMLVSDNALEPPLQAKVRDDLALGMLERVGAALVALPDGLLLIGGVCSRLVTQDIAFVLLVKTKPNHQDTHGIWHVSAANTQDQPRRSLLIGHSAQKCHDEIIILGGGAVCFSFGSYSNRDLLTLSPSNQTNDTSIPIGLLGMDLEKPLKGTASLSSNDLTSHKYAGESRSVKIDSVQRFSQIVSRGQPAIFKGVDLGLCVTEWTLSGLTARIGGDRAVSDDRLDNSRCRRFLGS